MVNLSVVLTVHDREDVLLLSALRMLSRGPAQQAEIIIVNDASEKYWYSWFEPYLSAAFDKHKVITLKKYERFTLAGGYGNPAKAFNAGIEAATRDRVMILSSDTLVPPATVRRSFLWDTALGPWTPRVLDLETQMEYCGPSRVFPMPWALVCDRKAVLRCGGWDERYMAGLCYEDNDFVGRLVVMQGSFCADWSAVAYHHSHEQPAYAVADPAVKEANDRNRTLTKEKWGGIPFDGDMTPFDVSRSPHPSGLAVYSVKCSPEKVAMLGLPVGAEA